MLGILFIVVQSTFVMQTVGKCSLNPYLPEFQSLLHHLDLNVTQYNSYVINTPSDQKPSVCTQMSTQSCCTSEFESYLQEVVTVYQNSMQDQYFKLEELIKSFESSLTGCGYRNNNSTFEKSQIGTQDLVRYNQIIQDIILLQAGFLRGSLCILCTTYDNTNFIDQNSFKIIANSVNYNDYKNKLMAQFTFLQTLIQGFKGNFMLYYAQNADTLGCSQVLEEFSDQLNQVQVCPGNDCAEFISQTVSVFENRILSEDDYFIQSADGGVLIYIAENAKKTINFSYTLGMLMIILFNI